MTIFEHGYRSSAYQPVSGWRRLWPIARMELRSMFRSGWGVAAFFVCLMPSLYNLVVMLMSLGVLQLDGAPRMMQRGMPRQFRQQLAQMLPDHVEFHVEVIVQYSVLPLLVVTAWVGCRAIAKDRAWNALELYWTRGIDPRGYFLAKWLGSFLLLSLYTVVAPLLVWLTGVLVAEDWGYLQDTVGFMPRVLLAHAVFAAVIAWLCLCLSALVRSPNFASMLWLMLVMFSGALSEVLGHVLRDDTWTRSVGLWISLADLDRAIAGESLERGSFGQAVGGVVGYVVSASAMMLRTMRRQEAVA